MHRKTAQAQAQQQPRHGDVAGSLTAHGNALALRGAFRDHVGHQTQHGGVQRVVQMGHRFVRAVDGQRVLDQVVRADRQEVEVAQEAAHDEGRRRHFDHGAQLHGAERRPARQQFLAGEVDLCEGLPDLADMREHGKEQVHRPVRRSPQHGAQLGAEHGGVGQAPANGAQAERGVEMAVLVTFVQRLVGPHVDGAQRHRQALHPFHGLAVRLVLRLFIGQVAAAVHEHEFTAEQAHADCARAHRRRGVRRLFDVGEQLDLLSIQGDGGRMPQPRQPFPLQRSLALAEAVFGQDDGRRIDDDDAGIAVDDDPVVLPHQLAGRAGTHDGGDVHAARDDGGVRGLAAHIGHEAGEHALLELQHVGRRQVMRHQHERHIELVVQQHVLLCLAPCAAGRRRHRARHAFHVPEDALDHLLQVRLALAQVLVLHLVELARDDLELRGERPFGVVQAICDPVLDAADQRLVLQQHHVHVQQGGKFRGRIGRHLCLQALQFVDHCVAAVAHANDFLRDLCRLDEVMHDVHTAGCDQHGPPDGDAPGDSQAVDGEGH